MRFGRDLNNTPRISTPQHYRCIGEDSPLHNTTKHNNDDAQGSHSPATLSYSHACFLMLSYKRQASFNGGGKDSGQIHKDSRMHTALPIQAQKEFLVSTKLPATMKDNVVVTRRNVIPTESGERERLV